MFHYCFGQCFSYSFFIFKFFYALFYWVQNRRGRQPSRGVERRVVKDRRQHPTWRFEWGAKNCGILKEERTGCHLLEPLGPTLRTTPISTLLSTRLLWVFSRSHLYLSTLSESDTNRYYCQRLLTEPRFSLLGRLLNEYLVDMFSSLEDSRLNYVTQHLQTRIAARRTGPASFMGSPWMQRRLIADGLVVDRRLGKPTYFIMVICNHP